MGLCQKNTGANLEVLAIAKAGILWVTKKIMTVSDYNLA